MKNTRERQRETERERERRPTLSFRLGRERERERERLREREEIINQEKDCGRASFMMSAASSSPLSPLPSPPRRIVVESKSKKKSKGDVLKHMAASAPPAFSAPGSLYITDLDSGAKVHVSQAKELIFDKIDFHTFNSLPSRKDYVEPKELIGAYAYDLPPAAKFSVRMGKPYVAVDETTGLFTVYRVSIDRSDVGPNQEGSHWRVFKRYSEFRALRDRLRDAAAQLSDTMKNALASLYFPHRTLFRSLDVKVVGHRRDALLEWLRGVISICWLHQTHSVRDEDTGEARAVERSDVTVELISAFLTANANVEPQKYEGEPGAFAKFMGRRRSFPGLRTSSRPTDDVQDEFFPGTPTHHKRMNSGTAAHSKRPGISIRDFELLRVVGTGSYGKVLLVRKKDTRKLYAMKTLAKRNVLRQNQTQRTFSERRVLEKASDRRHGVPYVVKLHYAFQTPNKLCLVLDWCPGGELFFHLRRLGPMSERVARFYCAELVIALSGLHDLGIVYRDLKPENVLLDDDGHIALADFGLSKEGVRSATDGAYSLCGTIEYLAPEVLRRTGHGTAVDWWALGMVLYEMRTGAPPWHSEDGNRKALASRILTAPLVFPPQMKRRTQAFIRALLCRNPMERIGSGPNRGNEIKNHHYFRGQIDWGKMYKREIPAPFKAPLRGGRQDTSNFDKEFTSLPLQSVERESVMSKTSDPKTFRGFTFEHDENDPDADAPY